MTRIFIDGKAGTTGLKIFSRFQNRPELELIQIDEDKRKDPAERAKCINNSDITFLCLPDPAAIEAVALVTNPKVKLIDTSTAPCRTGPTAFRSWHPPSERRSQAPTVLRCPAATPADLTLWSIPWCPAAFYPPTIPLCATP